MSGLGWRWLTLIGQTRWVTTSLLFTCLGQPAEAQAVTNPTEACSTLAERRAAVDYVMASIEGWANDIEEVPPSEAEYIEREYNAVGDILANGDERTAVARFRLVESNRFYHAHRLHQAFRRVMGSVNFGVTYQDDALADYVRGAANAFFSMAGLQTAILAYLEADFRRDTPIQDEAGRSRLTLVSTSLSLSLQNMIVCAANTLDGLGR